MDRYQRQTVLKEFGREAQQKLKDASVLVVGAGGLGIPVLQYLNAMGVGTLGIVEQDVIEITNLQRQVLYTENDLGKPKLDVVLQRLKSQNSNTSFKVFDTFLSTQNALDIISDFDVVVDGTDNFPTRYLINDSCVILKKPFVSGAIQGFEGQLSVFNYQDGPTYRCLFPNMPGQAEIPDCNENGVLGVVPGIIGNLQALEVIKVITGIGQVLSGKLLIFNGLLQYYQTISFGPCPENMVITSLQESYGLEQCDVYSTRKLEDLEKLCKDGATIQLIDVRTEEEYSNYCLSHIESKNIPMDELMDRTQELDRNNPIYILCQSGKRSAVAVKQLEELNLGLTLYHIEGGINRFLALSQ